MELAVAELQLKRKLAETAEHSIACKRLPVASMPQEVRFHQGLGRIVCKSKVLF